MLKFYCGLLCKMKKHPGYCRISGEDIVPVWWMPTNYIVFLIGCIVVPVTLWVDRCRRINTINQAALILASIPT